MDNGIRLKQLKALFSIASSIITLVLLQSSFKKNVLDITSLERYGHGKRY